MCVLSSGRLILGMIIIRFKTFKKGRKKVKGVINMHLSKYHFWHEVAPVKYMQHVKDTDFTAT